MNYKIYIYAIMLFVCVFALSGINFEKIIRKNKIIETRIFVVILSLALAYLASNFIFEFLNIF